LSRSLRRVASPSIAVLPFANLSSDKENEYFSDGLANEIITALMRVDVLRVTARRSSFAFRGSEKDVREIGKKLGAATLLEGSVQRAGERVRDRRRDLSGHCRLSQGPAGALGQRDPTHNQDAYKLARMSERTGH
jgi:TolB-like protein